MTIRLNWLNRNTGFDSVTIYRATTPILATSLPAPLVVLTAGETTYDDTTNLRNVLYYYAFKIKRGTDEAFSVSRPMIEMPYNGPGPQEIFRGDWAQGFFGEVPATQLFTAIELQQLVGLTSVTGLDNFVWFKFAHKGKILYIPSYHLHTNVGWNVLYAKGLVFGVDGVGPTGHSNPAVNQMVKVAKGDDQFIVRLPRANLPSNPNQAPALDPESEWVQCMYGYFSLGNGRMLGNYTPPVAWIATYSPMAEFTAGALTAGCHYLTGSPAVNTNINNSQRSATGQLWRPLLEFAPA